MTVYVYRNLRHGRKARPLYSIMRRGRVIARRRRVLLVDASFVVRETGRLRTLKTGHKNVHAFVKGTLVTRGGAFGQDANGRDFPIQIFYKPEVPYFQSYGQPVYGARAVLLNERGVTACYVSFGKL